MLSFIFNWPYYSRSTTFMHDIKSMTAKNAPTSLAISMVMQIRWYGAERIAQYGRSRATLDAQASICPVSSINFGIKNWVVALWNCFSKLAFKRHEIDPLLGGPAQVFPPKRFFLGGRPLFPKRKKHPKNRQTPNKESPFFDQDENRPPPSSRFYDWSPAALVNQS